MLTKVKSVANGGQSISSGWEGVLDQGEAIRWQGRPDPTVVWHSLQYASLLLGLAVSGFAVLWMIVAAQEGGWSWTFGLIFLSLGIFIALGGPYWRPYLRSKSWYTLTNKRALIATDLPILGRKIESYPITSQSPLELEKRYMTSVYFATEEKRNTRGPYKVKIGFELIDDAKHVFGLMCEIQKGTI